jgi:hypothetical protein
VGWPKAKEKGWPTDLLHSLEVAAIERLQILAEAAVWDYSQQGP